MADNRIPVKLKKAVEDNSLVLFIGAGLSYKFRNENKEIIHGWGNLVTRILDHLEAKGYNDVNRLKPLVGKYDPIVILDLIEKDKSLPKDEVISFVKDFFALSPDENDYTLHRKLCKLSGKIITTNYDNAFENAQPSLVRRTAHIGRDFELSLLHDVHEPVLFKLHGCIVDGLNMVLFPSNYDNLYVHSDEKAERITFGLQNLIFNKTLLFIGCGMGDFQINQILLGVKRLQGRYPRQHFIISKEPVADKLTADSFMEHIPVSDFSEIDGIIDELLRIKEETKNPETARLEKELEEAKKKLKETKNRHEHSSLKYFIKGLDSHLKQNYEEAIKYYEISIDFNPENDFTYNNWGSAIGDLARTKTGDEAKALYREAFEKYQRAIAIKPDKHDAYYNWGTYLGNLARTKAGNEAEALYREAFEKFQQAIAIKPNKHEAYYNWGAYLGNLARTETGDEADALYHEALYHEAFEKFQQVVTFKPDSYEAYNLWGTDLGDLAKTKTGDEAEALYREAFEKYQQAITIKPGKHEAYYNWGTDLKNLARTKTGDEADALNRESIEKCLKAFELSVEYYKLACLYALRSDRTNAFLYLEQSLAKKQILIDYVKQDTDWEAYRTDGDFLALLRRFE
ncbi:MAG: SIR2 family protein [Tannerella sp.]|jgi:tetratricopeptide (TPR) repeat protein|nr:SIR2 family protein [Tannerella sp.]